MKRNTLFVLFLLVNSTIILSQNETQNFSNVVVSGNLSVGTQTQIVPLTVNGDISVGLTDDGKILGEGNKLFFRGVADRNLDDMYISRYNLSSYETDLRINIGDDNGGDDRFSIGNRYWDDPLRQWHSWFTVLNSGLVGINTANPQYTLDVKGSIRATSVKIESVDNFADFVFDRRYRLRPLFEVEQFVQQNGHLPEIPSALEVKERGMDLVEMQVKLLQKVEELTLYVIQQQKTIEALKKQLEK